MTTLGINGTQSHLQKPEGHGLTPNGETVKNIPTYGPEGVEGQESTAPKNQINDVNQFLKQVQLFIGAKDAAAIGARIKECVDLANNPNTTNINFLAKAKDDLSKLNAILKQVTSDTLTEQITKDLKFSKNDLNNAEAALMQKIKDVAFEQFNGESELKEKTLALVKQYNPNIENALRSEPPIYIQHLLENVEFLQTCNELVEALGLDRSKLENMAEMLKEIKNTNAVPESVEKEQT